MTKEELIEKLEIIIVENIKECNYGEPNLYYFFDDVCDLLKKADPARYNKIFNETSQ